MSHTLSKSTFMRGVKCTKCLYLNKHHNELRDQMTEQQAAIFQQGTDIGELAQQLYPGGIDLTPESYYDFTPSIKATKEAISEGQNVIYEAAFQYNGVLAAMDILVRSDNGYKAYEVKSSTSVKPTYVQDAALQAYVIKGSGVNLEDISIVHLDNTYKKDGDIDVDGLFKTVSILKTIQPYLSKIPGQITQFKNVLAGASAPNISIGPQCNAPYNCDFKGHCWNNVPEYSVFDIANLSGPRKFELYRKGIVTLDQIPSSEKLSANQRIQVDAEVNRNVHIDKEKINNFLDELKYPLCFLDFETMAFAVPQIEKSSPYQPIVFQYSLHKLMNKESTLEHFEFLAPADGNDPRLAFIERLIEQCGTDGDILVYNISFEKRMLKGLALLFPQHKETIDSITSRLKDLIIPFQKKWYYTPEMRDSASLKSVYPALFSDENNSYSALNIHDGGMASMVYAQMFEGSYNGNYENARTDLLAYCKLDTLALVKLLEKLYEAIS